MQKMSSALFVSWWVVAVLAAHFFLQTAGAYSLMMILSNKSTIYCSKSGKHKPFISDFILNFCLASGF
jgi:hypothetical protein